MYVEDRKYTECVNSVAKHIRMPWSERGNIAGDADARSHEYYDVNRKRPGLSTMKGRVKTIDVRRRKLCFPVCLLALMMVLPLWIAGNGIASDHIDQPNDSESSTVGPNIYLPTEPTNGSSPNGPLGFYNNTTRITVLPDGTVIEEGGHKIGDDPGLLDDILPDANGRADIMIEIVGEPAKAHEGGAQNATYLEILHQRHQSVKDQIEEQELNVTLYFDTYLVSNMISANALASDVPTILTMENVSDVKQAGTFYPHLDTSVQTIRADMLWGQGLDGWGITIAIIDTGIDATHPSLDDIDDDPDTNDPKVIAFQDFSDWDIDDVDSPVDPHGHGTHVAGIAAGTGGGSPYIGVAPGARLVVAKVCEFDLLGDLECKDPWISAAIEWVSSVASTYGIQVVSMSLGDRINGDGQSPLEESTDLLVSADGLAVVVSAGNSGSQRHTVGRPGTSKRVITVAASYDEGDTDRTNDYLVGRSSRGPTGDFRIKPDVTAPGVEICSAFPDGIPVDPEVICFTSPDGIYRLWGGTSMAAPHISGLAALLLQSHPTWQPSQVKAAIINTAEDFTEMPEPWQHPEEPIAQGGGLVDAFAADEVEGRLYDEMAPDEVMVSFGGYLHQAHNLPMVLTRDVRLQNYYIPGGAPTVTYGFTVDSDDIVNEPGMDVDLNGMSSHTMSEGDAITFTLRITVNSVVPNDYYDGDVVASSSSGQILRLPFMVYMGQAELHVDPLLTNTESYFFALFPLIPTSVDMFVTEPDNTIVNVNLEGWSKITLETWGAVAQYPVRKDGSHVVTLDYVTGGHSGSLSGTFEADISTPDLSISVQETGVVGKAKIQVTSSEPLARQWIDDKPIRFLPHISEPIWGNEIFYPVQVAVQGREIHVVKHERNHEIIYIKSNDLGVTWEPPQTIANRGWPPYDEPYAPSLAVEGGIVHVTWYSDPQGPTGGDIYYRRSVNGVWEPPVAISEEHQTLWFSSVSAYQGHVHVAWSDKRDNPSAEGPEIYYKRSTDSGITWDDGDPFPSNDNSDSTKRLTFAPFHSWNPVIRATESGIHLVWDDSRNTGSRFSGDVYYMKSEDGWVWSAENRLTPSSTFAWNFPKISGSGNLLQTTFQYSDDAWFSAERSLNGGLTWDDGLGNENTPREITTGWMPSLDSSGRTAKGAFFNSAPWNEMNSFGWRGYIIESGDTQNAGGDWSTERIAGPIMVNLRGNDDGPKVGEDLLEEPIVVWSDYFGRNRFVYYTRHVEPRIRMTAPDGTTSVIPLTGTGNEWGAFVKLDQMGLYTVEAIGFDAAGNHDTALAFLGRLEWDSGGDIETHVSVHKDWAFQEAKLGLRSLYVLTEGLEQVDQFQDRFSPLGYQGLSDKDHVQAQSFKPSYPTVSSVNLYLMKTPGFIGDVVVEVRTDDETGFPSDKVITSTLLANNEISTTGGWVHAYFRDVPVVTDNTYHIVLRLTETQSPGFPTNYLGWKIDQENIDYYVRGRGTYNYGQGWLYFMNNADRIFKVYTKTAQPRQSDQRVDHTDGSFWGLCSVYTLLAQSFKPSHTTISEIELKLVTAYPSLDEDIWVEIREDNAGNPTGEILTRAMISGGDIPYLVPDWVLIDFADIPLNLDEVYHIALTWATEPEGGMLEWLADTGDIYVHGHATTYDGGYQHPGNDLLFRTHTKSTRDEATDQDQDKSTIGTEYYFRPGTMLSQSFIPAYRTISSIDIGLRNDQGGSSADVIVEIRESDPVSHFPTSVVFTRARIPNVEIPTDSWGPVHVDLPDAIVKGSELYHLVFWADGDPALSISVQTHIGVDPYPQGDFYVGPSWTRMIGWDLVFRIYTRSAYSEVVDQHQERTTSMGYGLSDSMKQAQSFVPAFGTVTEIDISLLNSFGSSSTDVIVEIRESDPVTGHPADEILTTSRILNAEIPQSGFGFVHVDFADVKVTPGEKYHIVWWADGPATFLSIETHYNPHDNGYDAYPRGEIYYGLGPPWQADEDYDAVFRTYTKSAYPEVVDQSQAGYTVSGFELENGIKQAQSFVPAYATVTAIDLKLVNENGGSSADVIVEIRESDPATGHPADEILTTYRILNAEIPQSPSQYVIVDFADVKVTPGEKYHIVWWADGDPATVLSVQTHYSLDYNGHDAYPRGEMYYGLGPPWQAAEGWDAVFRTHSRSPYEGISDAWLEVGISDSIREWEHIGIFIGSDETDNLFGALNDFIGGFFGIPDNLGYVLVPFTFHSETPGTMLAWTTKIEFT